MHLQSDHGKTVLSQHLHIGGVENADAAQPAGSHLQRDRNVSVFFILLLKTNENEKKKRNKTNVSRNHLQPHRFFTETMENVKQESECSVFFLAPGSTLTSAPSRRSGRQFSSTWFTTHVERAGEVS